MRILVAEDDPVHRRFLEATLLKWGYEVLSTSDGEKAWEILRQDDTPRLAILDWIMPGMDGVQLCREVRKLTRGFYVYILLLTVKAQKRDLVSGLEAGADDYLTKPFDPHELRARLRAGRRIVDLQEQLKSARERLQDQRGHDPLTGLWERSTILDVLRRELLRARHGRVSLGVLLADLDHFGGINNTYGPIAGDAVLREVARRILAAVRPYDSVGRYGADEFLMILAGCDGPRSLSVAERFRARIDRKAIDTSEGMIAATVSLGVAVCGPAEERDSNQLVRAAEKAVSQARSQGGNQVELGLIEEPLATEPPEPAQATCLDGGNAKAE